MSFVDTLKTSNDALKVLCENCLLTPEEKIALQPIYTFQREREALVAVKEKAAKKFNKLYKDKGAQEKIDKAREALEKAEDAVKDCLTRQRALNPYLNGVKEIPDFVREAKSTTGILQVRKNQDNTMWLISAKDFLCECDEEHQFTGSYNVIYARLLDLSYIEYLWICEALGAIVQGTSGYLYPAFEQAIDAAPVCNALNHRWNMVKMLFPIEISLEDVPEEEDDKE